MDNLNITLEEIKLETLSNHIFPREYWDGKALHDPYNAILYGFDEKEFWNEEVEIEGLNKNTIFLDLGCGIGRVTKKVAPLVKEYYGVDFSPEMIKKAKEIFKDYKNVYFQVNNGIDLRIFEDNKFDVVYVHLVFQHMQKEITFNYIREVHRVLKKGGIFFAGNIPKIEKYVGGLSEKELDEAMKPFKILNKKITEHYFDVQCETISDV